MLVDGESFCNENIFNFGWLVGSLEGLADGCCVGSLLKVSEIVAGAVDDY